MPSFLFSQYSFALVVFLSVQDLDVRGEKQNRNQYIDGAKYFWVPLLRNFPLNTEGICQVIKNI
ncbi:hypothetical protein J6TS1_43330 [Siminovitchia terrae]|uniref:Uncharacterized protein n=1 Tax=Siminovitchia terrae TaxID=1914933 RepID=A0ABQ4L2F3_SIMTE|nr:hypothetical protein J6TS1_43330 [Siminovitchia terrae]